MTDSPDLRQQLESLRIRRDQRPGVPRAAGGNRVLVLLLVMLILGFVGYVGWDRFGPKLQSIFRTARVAPAIQVFRVVAESAPDAANAPVLTATGKIVSDHRVQVSTKVSGQIVALHFEQGDRVAAGQLLAEIDREGPRALRDEAAARLERAKANLEYHRFNLARIVGLHETKQTSEIELAEARRAAREAEALVAAETAALDYAEKVLRDCSVAAPIGGVVLERNVEVGDFVAAEGGRGAMANAQFATIADMSKLRVEVDVSELDVNRLRRDMPCVVIPDAYKDRRYDGHVMWLDPGANYSKATVQVKVRIEQPDAYLRIEGAAQVQFFAERVGSASSMPASMVWVPAAALLPGGTAVSGRVFVLRDGRWRATELSLGARRGEQVAVSGLQAGDVIATSGLDAIREGDPYISTATDTTPALQ